MDEMHTGIHLRTAEDVDKLPSGSLIEGFTVPLGGYWNVDPDSLAPQAAEWILEKDTYNQRPAFHSKAAVVCYAVNAFDFQGRRTFYENQNIQCWQERICRYQAPMSLQEATDAAETIAYKEFLASGEADFNAYKATQQQEELLAGRIERFQQAGMREEEARRLVPDPSHSDTPSGLFMVGDLSPQRKESVVSWSNRVKPGANPMRDSVNRR